jgi:excinuclease ABC subunit B
VHVPNPGVAEAQAPFVRDMPMFAPVTGPRLTPEEAPGKPSDWTPTARPA